MEYLHPGSRLSEDVRRTFIVARVESHKPIGASLIPTASFWSDVRVQGSGREEPQKGYWWCLHYHAYHM